MSGGRKLAIGVTVIVAATAYVAYLGASASWQYYLTVDECLTDGPQLIGARIRLRGKVAHGSLKISQDRRRVEFLLSGTDDQMRIVCTGSLPDNLTEEMEVVAEGRLESVHLLQADKILTRCASKYESQGSE